jgi:hypothetical protein
MNLGNAYYPNKTNRHENEFYPTPPIATLSLIKNVNVPPIIWEPAAGRGHIAKELKRHGKTVVSTDLFSYDDQFVPVRSGYDFLTCQKPDGIEGIITNPPFKNNLPEKLILRTFDELNVKFLALFLRLTFLESARRYEMFQRLPPSRILVFSERIQTNDQFMHEKNGLGGMIAYGLFVWDYRNQRPMKPELSWIRPSDYIEDLDGTS